MSKIIFFHDFLLVMLLYTIMFVGFMMVYIAKNKIITSSYMEASKLEVIWTVVPMCILIVMFLPSFMILSNSIKVSKVVFDKMINVVGHQWKWEYEYSLGGEVLNYVSSPEESVANRLLETCDYLVLKSKADTLIKVSSEDVIHSFSVPSLGLKMDAVPGRVNEVVVSGLLSKFDVFYGQCSEMCGVLHSKMPMMVLCVPLSKFHSG